MTLAAIAGSGEVLVALRDARERLGRVTHVRSTLVLSSLTALRAAGLYDAYVAKLDRRGRDAILSVAAGVWIPIDVAECHYRACEALGISAHEQVRLGQQVGARLQGTFLGVVVRAAKGAGVTPWSVLGAIDRIWERTFVGGGGASLTKYGPKEAISELVGLSPLSIPYFRNAFRGAHLAAIELFSQKGYVHEIPEMRTRESAAYRLSWV